MKLDDDYRWFALMAVAATFVAGMAALVQGLTHTFGETLADFVAAALLLSMSAAIALEVRK
jgi:hypothetical protein